MCSIRPFHKANENEGMDTSLIENDKTCKILGQAQMIS